jgi:peptidyl-prolyl cis-trans isomerase SurA
MRALPALFFLILSASSAAAGEIVDRIVAVVNEEIVLLSELEEAARPFAERILSSSAPAARKNRMIFEVRKDILDKLVDQHLTDQEAERRNISVSKKEIDAAVERFKESNYLTDEQLRRMLESEGLTMEEYRRRVSDQILRSKLLNQEVRSKIVITDAEIRQYYESHPELYGPKKRVHLKNYLLRLPPSADPAEKRQALERMEGILERLREEASFDPTGTESRDLGFFAFDQLSPQLQEALGELEPGQHTPVLDTDAGLQIFHLRDVEVKPGKSLEEASGEIEQELFKEVVDEKFQAWLEELRKRSHIKIVL